MESFTQKTKIDLPDIRKRQTSKNKEKEIDYFNLLFEDNSETENALLGSVRHRRKFLQGYKFYLTIVFILFMAACFLVVQMVVNSPEVEKYKAVTKNIEEIDAEDREDPLVPKHKNLVKDNIPDVRFADPSENQIKKTVSVVQESKPALIKKVTITNKSKQITIIKQSHVIVQKPSPIIKNPDLSKKDVKSVTDIMLRPLAIPSEPGLRGLD